MISKKTLVIICLILAVIGTGWIMNLAKLSNCDFEAPYKAEIIHTVGLIPPIGAVTGWMELGK